MVFSVLRHFFDASCKCQRTRPITLVQAWWKFNGRGRAWYGAQQTSLVIIQTRSYELPYRGTKYLCLGECALTVHKADAKQ